MSMIQGSNKDIVMSNQREREQSDFVIPSEPKILCLVMFLSHLEDVILAQATVKHLVK